MHLALDRLSVDEIARLRDDVVNGLRLYFSFENPRPQGDLLLMSEDEMSRQLEWSLSEVDRQFIFFLLAEIEALFRGDFKRRKNEKMPDALSIKCRQISKGRGTKVRFDQDILQAWKSLSPGSAATVSAVRTAWRMRDWFAHGRHFMPKLGQKPDYFQVESLAYAVSSIVLK